MMSFFLHRNKIVQEKFRRHVLSLARHTGMSVPAALDGLATCSCATWTMTSLMYLCVTFHHEAVILRNNNKGFTCIVKRMKTIFLDGWRNLQRYS